MPKQIISLSLDVEASGPIPGPWWMCSFGVCRTDDVSRGLRVILAPLVVPGLSLPDREDAMRIVAEGVDAITWDRDASAEDNVATTRQWFVENGVSPTEGLELLDQWIREELGNDRPVLVGSPVTFDFMWMYWYWWFLRDEMPPFGFSGLDIRSYFMGAHGVGFLGTGKQRYLKHYPNEHAHSHDPLDDARQQGQIWQDLVNARAKLPRGLTPGSEQDRAKTPPPSAI